MRSSPLRPRRIALAGASTWLALIVACGHDFDAFDSAGSASAGAEASAPEAASSSTTPGSTSTGHDPSGETDAASDARSADAADTDSAVGMRPDGGPDTCKAPASCTSALASCDISCAFTTAKCKGVCRNDNGCKQNCDLVHTECTTGCSSICQSCGGACTHGCS